MPDEFPEITLTIDNFDAQLLYVFNKYCENHPIDPVNRMMDMLGAHMELNLGSEEVERLKAEFQERRDQEEFVQTGKYELIGNLPDQP